MKSVSLQKMNGLHQENSKENKPSVSLNRTEEEDEEMDVEQTDKNQKKIIITEKVIHSDYKKMFDDFQNNRFEAIRQKITN
jgi:hypothetical protein